MEGSTDAELQDALETGVNAAESNVQEMVDLAKVANDNLAQTEQQKAAVKTELMKVEQVESSTMQELSRARTRVLTLETNMATTRQKIDEFNQTLDADLKSGKITPEEAAQRSADFNDGLRTQASATTPTHAQPVLAANTDIPNTARPTASAASTLNDGGGIKAGSISNQFASAASGTTTPAAPAMEPERQPVYASPSMAMG
jgi:septal ring factor EnvC (AmiA/AmiB activator)